MYFNVFVGAKLVNVIACSLNIRLHQVKSDSKHILYSYYIQTLTCINHINPIFNLLT